MPNARSIAWDHRSHGPNPWTAPEARAGHDLSPMRVLVLGGNRYIGRHLVFELARRGHDVSVLNSHVSPLPDGTRRLHGDRRRPGVLRDVLGDHRDEFDVVFDNTA